MQQQLAKRNPFADYIVDRLSSQVLFLDSVVGLAWVPGSEAKGEQKAKNGYLLARLLPPAESCYDPLKAELVQLFRDDRPESRYPYKMAGKCFMDADMRRNMILKFWLADQPAENRKLNPTHKTNP